MLNLLTSRYTQYALIALLIASTHFYAYRSGINNERAIWNERVALLEQKNKDLIIKQETINKNIAREVVEIPIEKVITRNKIIKEEIYIPIERDCSIPEEAIDIYNRSITK